MKIKLKIEGMSCGHCKARVTKMLEEERGVAAVAVNLEAARAEFDADEGAQTRLSAIIEKLSEEGYIAARTE